MVEIILYKILTLNIRMKMDLLH